jgi:hypothetical protein
MQILLKPSIHLSLQPGIIKTSSYHFSSLSYINHNQLHPLQIMSRPLTMFPNPLTIFIQHERDRNKRHTYKRQRRTSPIHTKIVKHGSSEQREPSAETAAHEIVARIGGGCVFGICIADVVENGVEEEEGADTKE